MALFDQPKQTRLEEYLNGLTHGAGFFLCLIASPYLMYQAYYAQIDYAVIACAVFCSSMLLMYGASTIYHLTNSPRRKMQMRSLDHICIFVLIAGSYTPFALLALPVDWGITFFVIAWSLAIIGIAFKIWFFERFEKISYLFYLAMGWLSIFGYTPLKQALGDGGMWLLIGGGAAYTIGILFFLLDQRIRFFHTLWHLFVVAGSAFHFLAVYKYVI
jgi:hemolysin III